MLPGAFKSAPAVLVCIFFSGYSCLQPAAGIIVHNSGVIVSGYSLSVLIFFHAPIDLAFLNSSAFLQKSGVSTRFRRKFNKMLPPVIFLPKEFLGTCMCIYCVSVCLNCLTCRKVAFEISAQLFVTACGIIWIWKLALALGHHRVGRAFPGRTGGDNWSRSSSSHWSRSHGSSSHWSGSIGCSRGLVYKKCFDKALDKIQVSTREQQSF